MMQLLLKLTAVLALALAGSLAMGNPATAAPSGCSVWAISNGASAKCTSGTGQVRAGLECFFWKTGNTKIRYGSWVNVGSTSTAKCLSAERATPYRFYETR